MSRDLRNTILIGDVRQRMSEIASNSVDCVITSPPYFQLRNYRQPDQIGLERAVSEWVESLRAVLAEIARVLKPSGSVWLNVGDTHSGHVREGALPKSLLLGPERLDSP
jgi:DNA modification methylase